MTARRRGGPSGPVTPSGPEPWGDADFAPIGQMLRERYGLALPEHRLVLLQARLQTRLRGRGIASFHAFYESALRDGPDGAGMQLLIDLSTVNHTAFFREPGPLEALAVQLASWLRGQSGVPVRVWSAGCSAGQEPYSLAIALSELVPGLGPGQLELWASDLSQEMIETASRAIYAARELTDVAPDRLRRYFLRGHGRRAGWYRVAPEVRRLVRFQRFDLHGAEWPVPNGLDAILCRNVALYFTDAERPRLLERLAGHLRTGGWLIIGHCEIISDVPRCLARQATSIYRKVATS